VSRDFGTKRLVIGLPGNERRIEYLQRDGDFLGAEKGDTPENLLEVRPI
jgi:hypothetical protein